MKANPVQGLLTFLNDAMVHIVFFFGKNTVGIMMVTSNKRKVKL